MAIALHGAPGYTGRPVAAGLVGGGFHHIDSTGGQYRMRAARERHGSASRSSKPHPASSPLAAGLERTPGAAGG